MRRKILPVLVISFLILTGCAAAETPVQITELAPLPTPVQDEAQIQFLEFYSPF